MKKLIFLLLLLPVFANAQFVNDFTGQNVILPSDTSKLNHSYYTKHGQIMYMGSTLFVNNGTTWSAIGATNYYAGFGLGLHIDTFYVDTSKIVTRLSLGDSLGLYATKVALTDTAGSIRTQNATFATHTALVDTAAAIRASSSSTAGLATTVALTDTAAVLRAYAQTNLNDTAIAIRSAIPSIAGLATTVSLTDTAIARAATAQTNLVDTSIAIRGSFPSTAGLATTVALTDTAIARAATAQTNLVDTASALRATINTKLSSVSVASGTGINVVGSSPSYTVNATGGLTAGTGISLSGSFPTYTVTNSSPSSGGTVTSVGVVAGTGVSITGISPITSSGTFTVVNTAPDQTVSLTSGTGISATGTYPNFTITNTSPSSGGTVTSVGAVAGTGISIAGSSPITGSGTYTVTNSSPDKTVTITGGTGLTVTSAYPSFTLTPTGVNSVVATGAMTVAGTSTVTVGMPSANSSTDGYLLHADWTTFNGKGSGTVTSVGLIGSTTMSVTGTASPITTSGTYTLTVPASSIGTVNLSATGTPSATTFLRGDNTWGVPSGSATSPGGSNTQIQYNNSGSFGGVSNVEAASDGTMLFVTGVYTTAVTAPSSGTVKLYGSSINGQDELWTSNSAGVDIQSETFLGQHQWGLMTTNGTAIQYQGFFVSAISPSGTAAFNLRTYDATNLAPNLMYYKLTGSASPNNQVELWFGFTGRDAMIGNNTYGAGSKLVIDCVIPAYASTQRFFAGYTSTFGQMATTTDPSSVLNIIGVGKDAGDATLQFMFNNGSGTATKVNTGITPTVNDEYIITVTLPSNTTSSTVAIERRTKSASTKNSATNSAKIPSAGTLMYWHAMSNSASASTAPTIGIKQVWEELYN